MLHGEGQSSEQIPADDKGDVAGEASGVAMPGAIATAERRSS